MNPKSVPKKKLGKLKTEHKKKILNNSDPTSTQPKSQTRKRSGSLLIQNSEMTESMCYDDLPESVKRKCNVFQIDQHKINRNIEAMYTIAKFLYSKEFTKKEDTKPRARPYATEEMLALAEKEIQLLPKSIKKKYKKPQLYNKGGFGTIYLSKDLSTKKREKVIIKKLPNSTPKQIQSNQGEIYYLMKCQHPNIVKFHHAYLFHDNNKPDMIWLIMEYLHGGTLADAAKAYNFTDTHIAFTAREILKGILFLHEQGFAHRDLKSSNVMLSIHGEIKLIDFGLCADFSDGPRCKIVGSPYWVPPEMILNKPHSLPVDIWSFAVCILELFLNAPPHNVSALKCMFYACTDGLIDTIPHHASPNAKNFLQKCLVLDPDERATASELLKHPWVNQAKIGEGFSVILEHIFLANYLYSSGL